MPKKNKYNKSLKYNRQTKGHLKNLAKGKMNELGVRAPDKTNINKVLKISRILFFAWIPFAGYCAYKFMILGLLFAMLIALIYIFGLFKYVQSYQYKLVMAYMELDIPKAVYMEEMKKRKQDEKSLRKLSKIWDETEKKFSAKCEKTKKRKAKAK